jgi:chromatin remodeling complex protein RSC6
MPAAVSKKSAAVSKPDTVVVEAKSSKKAVTVKPEAEPVPVPVPVPVQAAVSTPVVVEDVASVSVSQLAPTDCPMTCKLNEIDLLVSEIDIRIKDLKIKAKLMRKDVAVLLKQQQKASKKSINAANRAPRAPSGFAKPTTVSDEMYAFLSMEVGTPIARVDVTRKINEYIKTNALQNPSDKRQIIPDLKLSTLLKLAPTDHVTFFNLQTYLSKHFVKKVVV